MDITKILPTLVDYHASIIQYKNAEDEQPVLYKSKVSIEEMEEYVQITLTPSQAKKVFEMLQK